MKHIKYFENSSRIEIEVNEYVLIKTEGLALNDRINKSKKFVNENIGKCIYINYQSGMIGVKYYDIPDDIHTYFNMQNKTKKIGFRHFEIYKVIYHSKNKEDIQAFIDSSKYNI